MKSAAVNAGDNATAQQYNDLRQDANGGSFLLPHEQGSPNMTVKIEAGIAFFGTTKVEYAGGNSPTMTAPAANPRIDLISIDSSGTITVTNGTEAASPAIPATPANHIAIARIYHRVGSTSIKDADDSTNSYIQKDVRSIIVRPQSGGDLKIFLSAADMQPADGAGFGSAAVHVLMHILFSDAATRTARGQVKVPEGATSISSIVIHASSDGGSGAVARLKFVTTHINTDANNAAGTLDDTDTLASYTKSATTDRVIDHFTVPAGAYNGLTIDEHDIIAIEIQRQGADGSDTINGDFQLYGCTITFT